MKKKNEKSTIDICIVVCVLVFAPYVYIELPLGSSERELNIQQFDLGSLYIQELWKKMSEVNNIYLLFVCILVFAPFVYMFSSL